MVLPCEYSITFGLGQLRLCSLQIIVSLTCYKNDLESRLFPLPLCGSINLSTSLDWQSTISRRNHFVSETLTLVEQISSEILCRFLCLITVKIFYQESNQLITVRLYIRYSWVKPCSCIYYQYNRNFKRLAEIVKNEESTKSKWRFIVYVCGSVQNQIYQKSLYNRSLDGIITYKRFNIV